MYVRTCPKCAYARQAADTAPDWQCPSCGIAYAKASADLATARREERMAGQPAPQKKGGGLAWLRTAGLVLFAGAIAYGAYGKFIQKPAPAHSAAVVDAVRPLSVAVLYSTAWCPYCKAARELLDKRGVEYIEIDVEKQPDRQQHLIDKFHVSGFPILEVGDDIVVGYEPGEIEKLIVHAKRI